MHLMKQCCRVAGILALLSLAACQSTMNRMADCKSGDWQMIGNKDGSDGLDPRFEERKRFCSYVDGDKITQESSTHYQQGWNAGNQQFWYRLGRDDGRNGFAVSQFQVQLRSPKIIDNKTPVQQASYEQGWQQGNHEYWYQTGFQDGKSGQTATKEQERALAGEAIGFRSDSYRQGWQEGNYAYWELLGYQDAHDGVPDSNLSSHTAAAKSRDLLVRPEAYRAGWDKEIVEYWRNLGWNDAVSGRDIYSRRDEAKRKGLKIFEAEYRQKWEERLVRYWAEVGASDGNGKPFQLEQRMANARNENVFVITQTRDVYTDAWNRQNAAYCTVDHAFEWSRKGQRMAIEVCRPELQGRLQRAVIGGRDYEDLARRAYQVQRDIDDQLDRSRDLERRLARLEAEIRRNQDDKNRPNTPENASIDKRNEKDRNELRDAVNMQRRRIDDMRGWAFRYQQQMEQLRRDIYR